MKSALLILAGLSLPVLQNQEAEGEASEECPYVFEHERKLQLADGKQHARYQYRSQRVDALGLRQTVLGIKLQRQSVNKKLLDRDVELRAADFDDGRRVLRLRVTRILAGDDDGLGLGEGAKAVLEFDPKHLGDAQKLDFEIARVMTPLDPSAAGRIELLSLLVDARQVTRLLDSPTWVMRHEDESWKVVLDGVDREALRWFLWTHAEGGRPSLTAYERAKKKAEAEPVEAGG